jgi:hypothetical protein
LTVFNELGLQLFKLQWGAEKYFKEERHKGLDKEITGRGGGTKKTKRKGTK